MSRSVKKNSILKSGRFLKSIWWRIIRSRWRQELRTKKEEVEFEDEYAINNQYDHCDYKLVCNGNLDRCNWCKKIGYQKCKKK